MDDSDYGTFERAFGRVSGAFQLRLKAGEREELTKTYFRLLEGHPIEAVLQAGKTCMQTLKHFPKPVEWLAELEAARPITAASAAWRQMSVTELEERARADRLRYRDHPCLCTDCVRAGVDDQELRFVPTLRLDEEEDRAFNPRRNGLDVVGHWAHGEELRRWYAAKAAFIAATPRPDPRRRVMRLVDIAAGAIEAIVVREPGEEG